MRDIIGERSASTLRPPNQLPVREVSMAVKKCTKCGEVKPFSDFHKRAASRDGLMPICNKCNIRKSQDRYKSNPALKREYDRAYRAKNYESLQKRWLKYASDNADAANRRAAEYREKFPERVKAAEKQRLATEAGWQKHMARQRRWRKNNPDKRAALVAVRRAKKAKATPAWANSFFIGEAYRLAKQREAATGIKWHVDHTVPLHSKLVCGLHCESNLAVIPAKENIMKNNRHWPDMP